MVRGLRGALIDGYDFHGDYARSVVKSGYFLDPDGVQDWLGGGAWMREEIAKPNGFGAFGLPGRLPQKVIPISGTIIAQDAYELPYLIRSLTGIMSDGECDHVMAVTDLDGTTTREVGLAISPKPRELDERTARFTMSVWAADPRAYGELNVSAPGESVKHYGNTGAWPTLSMTAQSNMHTGYTIHGPSGKRYVVTQPISTGQTHVIDMRTGWLSLDGVLQVGAVARADTWQVPAGRSVLHTLEPASGTGLLFGTVVDTFI